MKWEVPSQAVLFNLASTHESEDLCYFVGQVSTPGYVY